MHFPAEISNEIRARLEEARVRFPAALSRDQQALLVDGGIGYACFISPEGDVYYESYDWTADEPARVDRSPQAQLRVLVLGARLIPSLREMLPARPPAAPACRQCDGTGWQEHIFICQTCNGLGWLQAEPATPVTAGGQEQPSASALSRPAFPKP